MASHFIVWWACQISRRKLSSLLVSREKRGKYANFSCYQNLEKIFRDHFIQYLVNGKKCYARLRRAFSLAASLISLLKSRNFNEEEFWFSSLFRYAPRLASVSTSAAKKNESLISRMKNENRQVKLLVNLSDWERARRLSWMNSYEICSFSPNLFYKMISEKWMIGRKLNCCRCW